MSYQLINNSEIATGAPIDSALFGKVKNNLDDHEGRIVIPPNVQTTVLSSYFVGANGALANTDTVVAAFGKVQGQINALAALSYEPVIPTGTTSQYIRGNKTLSSFSADVNALQYWAKTTNQYTLSLPSNQLTVRMGTGFTSAQGSGNGVYTLVDGYNGNNFVQDVVDTGSFTTSRNNIVLRSAHGATGALTAIQSGEIIAQIVAKAHGGVNVTGYQATDSNAKIEFKATETQSGGNQGTSVGFYATKDTTIALTKVMELVGPSTNVNGLTVRIGGMSSGAGTQGTYSVSSNDMKAALDVNGSLITRTYTYANGSVFDCSKSNSMAVTAPTGSSFTLDNIADGGVYSIAFQDSSTITPAFSMKKAEDGTTIAAGNIKYNPALGARTAGKHSIFTVSRIGTFCYMTWMEI